MTTRGDTADRGPTILRIPLTTDPPDAPDDLPTYVLRPDEPLAEGLQRIVVAQYDRMLDAFEAQASELELAVHSFRKAQKRTRALLRLVRFSTPTGVYRTENAALRDTARVLSDVRDGHVQLSTLDGLEQRFAGLVAPSVFRDAESWLRAVTRKRETDLLADRDRIDRLEAAVLNGRARWIDDTVLGTDDRQLPDRFASIEDGLAHTYRRGRKSYRAAKKHPSTESLHAWRKSVKYLRYQLETLESIWPDLLDAHIARLTDLGELLGVEHDLAILGRTVDTSPEIEPTSDASWLLGTLIERRRGELRRQALALGPSLFSEGTEAFTDRLRGYWVTGRRPRPDAITRR